MRHGSLFSGIGGFDLASQWMSWENVFHCEWMEFPRKVLHHYWPDAISYQDITQTDFTKHHGTIDILTGGFPCQPYSAAGKRKGKDDERHLWPHMLRAIREIRPRWVVGENVFGIVTWNDGLVFEEVCAELESEGYEVQPFILPAAAVNAPHRRDRVWFVAHAKGVDAGGTIDGRRNEQKTKTCIRPGVHDKSCNSCEVSDVANAHLHGRNQCNGNDEVNASEGRQYAQRDVKPSDEYGDIANASSEGLEGLHIGEQAKRFGAGLHQAPDWEDFPTVAPICGGDDGIPRELDGITFPKWRAESIKGYGNAIVPQVALQIFRAIAAMESHS